MTECPAPDVIAAFAAGELTAESRAPVELHVSRCDSCLETVGYLTSKGPKSESGVAVQLALPRAEQVIGLYRLIRKIGEGGMGEVWQAQQISPVRRTVALKLLKAGMDTRQIVTRFEAERQVLALMHHPGIAQVFDAGITEAGRPYFVMELVEGASITAYCDQANLSVRERLKLFQQVCEAVQHAHQKGVIHRDIKPSNVLIAQQGSKPLPKVIDFGLAKAITGELEAGSFTELGTLLGTPAYASPEQMSLGAIDIDTRSDVYSLGALLYELLVGVLPFEAPSTQPLAMMELRRTIRELEPTRPSARLPRLGARESQIAQARGLEAPALRKQLRGDLDWIVMKALEKERERRYTSPHELSLDIDRYLDHEPLQAGPPTAMYRTRKFVRRHRIATAFAATISTVLIAFLAVTLLQAQRIARERDRATAEAEKADAINTFLQETLGAADPWQAGKDISVRETLQQAAAQIDATFKDKPLIAAEVRQTIGATYLKLGRYQDSEPLLLSALATRQSLLGSEHIDVAQSLFNLAELYIQQTNHGEAEKYARLALAMRRKLLGDVHEAVAESLGQLAHVLFAKGNYTAAAHEAEASLAMREELFGANDSKVTKALQALANIVGNGAGDFARAEKLYLRAYDIELQAFGKDDLRTAYASAELATNFSLQGNFQRAEELLSAALPTMERHLGKDHPDVATYVENLGGVLLRLNRFDEALEFANKALVIRKTKLGEDNANVARTLLNIAIVQKRAGRLDESAESYAEALPRMKKAYGDRHPDVGKSLYHYGRLREAQKLNPQAEELYRQALGILESTLPDDHPDLADTRSGLGRMALERAAFNDGEALLLEAYAVNRKIFGPSSEDTRTSAETLAKLYMAWGKPEKAAEYRSAASRR